MTRKISHQLTQLNNNPQFQTFLQRGGKINLSSTFNQASNLLQKGISTAQAVNARAEELTQLSSQLSSEVTNLTNTASKYLPTPDLNFTSPVFSQSAASPPNSNQKFQAYGDSICLSKEFLRDLRLLLNELFAPRNEVPN